MTRLGSPLPKKFSGDFVGRVTPVPIPNTEVKPAGADGTARETVWESRKSPGLLNASPLKVNLSGLFCVEARLCRIILRSLASESRVGPDKLWGSVKLHFSSTNEMD